MRPLLLLLLAVAALRGDEAKPADLCTITVDGGIAGLHRVWRVAADGAVTRDDRPVGRVDTERLRDLLDRLAAEPAVRKPNGADLQHYQVVVPRSDGERRIEAWDTARPKPLDELMDLLRGAADAAPAKP